MTKAALEHPRTGLPALDRFCQAVKQNMDQMNGQTRNTQRMEPLPDNANMAQIIDRLNEIAERLQ